MEEIVAERSPLHRQIDADDCGAAAAYLLSDDARNITGDDLTWTRATTRWGCNEEVGIRADRVDCLEGDQAPRAEEAPVIVARYR